jgi:hypothetical protein
MHRFCLALPFLLLGSASLLAQNASSPSQKQDEPSIQDNSFMVEEAYNQENGVIQHISMFQRLATSEDWVYTYTDEWPVRSLNHQLSVTLAETHAGAYRGSGAGWGDTAINYRYQLIGSGETRVAMAPRFSVLIPSGDQHVGRGLGGHAIQTNIPLSVVVSKQFVTHWNAGATWAPHARNDAGAKAGAVNVNLGHSIVWLARPRFNALLETAWTSSEAVVGRGKTQRYQTLYMNPGVRWAYNFKSGLQIVPGVAVPIGVGPSSGEKGLIAYLSFEHPFAWAKGK